MTVLCLLLLGCGSGKKTTPAQAEPSQRVEEMASAPEEEPIQDRYLSAYMMIRDAEELEAEARWEEALDTYEKALEILQESRKDTPSWGNGDLSAYRTRALKDRLPVLQEKIASKGRLPDVARPADGDPQAWYLKIQKAMKEARDLDFDDEDEMAYRHYQACLNALDQLPEGFNEVVVSSRRRNLLVKMGRLKSSIRAARKAEEMARLEERLGIEPDAKNAAEPEAEITGLMGSSMPAPMEGEQALFLETIEQVRTARRLEGQGKLKPALYEYEQALRKMKKLNPKLKHGDGGPDDDVRESIRKLKRQIKR